MKDTRPKWFKEFLQNDFSHVKNDIKESKWLWRIIAGGLILYGLGRYLFDTYILG